MIPDALSRRSRGRLDTAHLRLGEYARETEALFLELGGDLIGLAGRASELTRATQQVSDLVGGSTMKEAQSGLADVVSGIESLLGEEIEAFAAHAEELAHVEGALHTARQNVAGFGKLVKSLKMLGVSTKIVAAKLGSAGDYSEIGEQVRELAARVESAVRGIEEQETRLSRLMERARQSTETIRGHMRDFASGPLARAHGALRALTQHHRNAAAGVLSDSERLLRITQSLEDAVAAVQEQDIARQRIEHAQSALQDLAGLFADTSPDDGDHAVELLGAAHACDLQAGALREAEENLGSALREAWKGIDGIIESLVAMMGSAQRSAADERIDDHSFVEAIRNHLAGVQCSLDELGAERAALDAIFASVISTGPLLAELVAGIDGIGKEIRFIALNSRVRVEKIAQGGRTLSALVLAVKEVSNDTGRQARGLSDTLRSVIERTTALGEALMQWQEKDIRLRNDLTARIHEHLESLSTLDSHAEKLLDGIRVGTRALASDTELLSSHRRTALAPLADVIETIEAVGRETRALVPAGTEFVVPERFERIFRQYTMASERDHHRGFLAAAGGAPADEGAVEDAPDEEAVASGSAFGDNVDLF